MKASDDFKKTIQEHLEKRAQTDELFAVSYAKESKNIDDCINYILNTIKSSGRNGFTDAEIFCMSVHYYDEDNIKIGKLPSNMKVVVNHHVKLSNEDEKKAYDAAYEKAKDDAYNKITLRNKPKKENTNSVTPGLFD